MDKEPWAALAEGQTRLDSVVGCAKNLKVASQSLGDVIATDPSTLEQFIPKGTKKSKDARTKIMLLYVRVLKSVLDLKDAITDADEN
eukprot:8924735-Karenia_brevis.AAC.1